MNILVTGAAGFIGSNFVRLVLERHPEDRVVSFDKLTYAGSVENLEGLDGSRHEFVKGDISLEDDVNEVMESRRFDAVVNFAAESHVDRSLHSGSSVFVETNVMGTQMLLDASRRTKAGRFVQVSTDEVYGSLGPSGRFTEESPIQPNNPYAATKAGADFMVRAAHKSYGLDVVTTRCSNNFGPRQFPEKLIPLMISNALEDREIPVYGDGMQVRDWIYVEDHCSAIDVAMRKAKSGSVYNIGSSHEFANMDIVVMVLRILGKPESLIRHVQDRPGHDRRYAMDSGRITEELGWRPETSFAEGMEKTVSWYLGNRDWLNRVRGRQS